MPAPLVPARLAFAADGTPFSQEYGDVYHSAEGGPGQAAHVFLKGNQLPRRWAGRDCFVILETGFGFGLNFLVTWQAWRRDAARCRRLHYVSIEKHPFTVSDLELLYKKYPELKSEAEELRARWPMLVPGGQRLEFDGGRVVLTLFFSDIAAIRDLALAADAVFLDGFAPDRNPAMWSPPVLRHLGRLAAHGATAATWSVAASVRSALEESGWAVEKRAGFGAKKEMLAARLAHKGKLQSRNESRTAVVIGAGIAGAAVCERLAARGWRVTLLERQPAPPADPGRHAGVFHPVVTRDDSLFARLTRAGFLSALARWRALEAAGRALEWNACGVLQLARAEQEEAAQRAAIGALALPPDYAQYATRQAASAHAGAPVAAGGLWFPSAGWIKPLSLVRAQLASAAGGLEARFGCEVSRIASENGGWRAYDRAGAALAHAPVMVLANAAEALQLAPSRCARIRKVRGQISFLPAGSLAAPRMVVLRGGFVLPAQRGESITGASYDFDDDPAPRAESHAGNLERLARILPGAGAGLDPAALEGLVGFRAVAPDRLPLIGALADEAAPAPKNALPATLLRLQGLYGAFAYGSRGLLWAGLGAELLASMLEGEPLPVEGRLADALDPGRFLLRALRRGAAAHQRSSSMSS